MKCVLKVVLTPSHILSTLLILPNRFSVSKAQKLHESTLNAYSLHVNIEFVDSVIFCQKSCQLLQYQSDTCTRLFFQIVLLQPLEADLVRTNNKYMLGFTSDNLQFFRTKAAKGCKSQDTLEEKRVRYLLRKHLNKTGVLNNILKMLCQAKTCICSAEQKRFGEIFRNIEFCC